MTTSLHCPSLTDKNNLLATASHSTTDKGSTMYTELDLKCPFVWEITAEMMSLYCDINSSQVI